MAEKIWSMANVLFVVSWHRYRSSKEMRKDWTEIKLCRWSGLYSHSVYNIMTYNVGSNTHFQHRCCTHENSLGYKYSAGLYLFRY